jgi:DNA-binding response OmpR family regulator
MNDTVPTEAAPRVLVADDDPDIMRVLVHNLEAEGFRVTTCDNGEDARDMARAITPDLIILDVMMPKRDGLDVLASLKSNPSTRAIPVVMLSAKSNDHDVWEGWRAGADYYVTKPFEMDELLRFVTSATAADRRSS